MHIRVWSITYTSVVLRAFMAGAASQAGDADSSRAPGLTSGLQRSVNVHRGALLLVPQWQCISSFVFYISTYSKWLYNDQFRSYFSIHVYSSFPYNSFSKFDHIGSYKVYATCIPTDIESRLLRRPYSHISCKPNVYLPPCITPIPIPFESLCTHVF